jgi:hypothetical protein
LQCCLRATPRTWNRERWYILLSKLSGSISVLWTTFDAAILSPDARFWDAYKVMVSVGVKLCCLLCSCPSRGESAAIVSDPIERLARIAGMLGSAHDGERAAAAKMASAMLKAMGLTWSEIIYRGLSAVSSRRAHQGLKGAKL